MRRLLTYMAAFLASCCMLSAQPAKTDVFLKAAAAYAEGEFQQALLAFSNLYELDPEDDAVCYYLGLCEFAMQDGEGAEQHLGMAVQKDSTNEWYLHALATVYNAKGDMVKSAELLEKLVKMNSGLYGNPYTLTLIGDAKLRNRQDSLALSYYNQALEVEPDYAPAELSRAEVYRMQGNIAPFFVSLEKILRNETADPVMKSSYLGAIVKRIDSRFYWAWGEQLNKVVDVLLEVQPDDIEAHKLKANMLSIKADWDVVLEQCAQMEALALAQDNKEKLVEAIAMAGDIKYQYKDNRKAAYKDYERALKVDPEYAPVLNNYAYYLSEEGRQLKKALEMSRKTVEKEPDNATYLDTYGWLLYQLKRAKEAKPYFKHAMLYGGKDSAVVLEHYSKVLEALGEKDLASYYKSLSEQKKSK